MSQSKHTPESHLSRIVRRKLAAPPEWEICGWKRVGTDGLIVEGGIPRALKSGPRKGEKTWRDSDITSAVVTDGELDAERAAYEANTGMCAKCLGSGEVWAGWKLGEGHKYKPCQKCGASGSAKAGAATGGGRQNEGGSDGR